MSRKIGVVLLAIWLVLTGFLAVTNFRFEQEHFVMGILAIAAGIFLALDR
jgi:hypothetical protein